MLFARILSSWFPELHNLGIMRLVMFYTEPYLDFFRKLIPPLGFIDISPIFAFFALQIIKSILFQIIIWIT